MEKKDKNQDSESIVESSATELEEKIGNNAVSFVREFKDTNGDVSVIEYKDKTSPSPSNLAFINETIRTAKSLTKSNFYNKKKLKKKINMFVFNSYIKNKLKKYEMSTSKIIKLIKKISKINIYGKNNENKTVYLGRLVDKYYEYAQQDSKGISFHMNDNDWNNYANKYGYDVLWLINNIFLNYVILKKWKIVLVSNPNDYYDVEKNEKKDKYFYSKELEVLYKLNRFSWIKDGNFWNIIRSKKIN